MTITEIEGIIVVTASEGKVLTNTDQSLHSEQLWLGVDDSPDNYFEVDPPSEEDFEMPKERDIRRT